jgi:hypothetical protein
MRWIIIGILLLVVFYLIFSQNRDKNLLESVTKRYRGTNAERDLVLRFLKLRIPVQMIFHDLYLEKSNNSYSQIDVVLVTKVGIVVLEVKDYKGWIFGTGYKSQWVQVLAYGKIKHRFYNPVIQNTKHIQDLKKQLKEENIPFFSVVVFYGNCVLKDINFIPNGTFVAKSERIAEVITTIMRHNNPAQYNNLPEVIRILGEAVKNGENLKTQTKHVENIKNMLGRDRIFD